MRLLRSKGTVRMPPSRMAPFAFVSMPLKPTTVTTAAVSSRLRPQVMKQNQRRTRSKTRPDPHLHNPLPRDTESTDDNWRLVRGRLDRTELIVDIDCTGGPPYREMEAGTTACIATVTEVPDELTCLHGLPGGDKRGITKVGKVVQITCAVIDPHEIATALASPRASSACTTHV